MTEQTEYLMKSFETYILSKDKAPPHITEKQVNQSGLYIDNMMNILFVTYVEGYERCLRDIEKKLDEDEKED